MDNHAKNSALIGFGVGMSSSTCLAIYFSPLLPFCWPLVIGIGVFTGIISGLMVYSSEFEVTDPSLIESHMRHPLSGRKYKKIE